MVAAARLRRRPGGFGGAQRGVEQVLLREHGVSGTSFGDVIEHSGAPRGSIYHHFPGGKSELVEEAVRYAGAYVGATIERSDGDPVALLRDLTAFWRATLEDSDFRAGCPVVAVAVESGDEERGAVAAAAEVFAAWRQAIERVLRTRGVAAARARSLATTSIAAIEGAVVLCRVERDVRPLLDVSRELERALGDAIADA